jgi:hypothetical protein
MNHRLNFILQRTTEDTVQMKLNFAFLFDNMTYNADLGLGRRKY